MEGRIWPEGIGWQNNENQSNIILPTERPKKKAA
jgi:hypothetical protein